MSERTPLDTRALEIRMGELSRPIEEAILLCDDSEEMLMLASVMMVRLKTIFDTQLGTEGRKRMFRSMT